MNKPTPLRGRAVGLLLVVYYVRQLHPLRVGRGHELRQRRQRLQGQQLIAYGWLVADNDWFFGALTLRGVPGGVSPPVSLRSKPKAARLSGPCS